MKLSDPIALLAGGAPVTVAAHDTGPYPLPVPIRGAMGVSSSFTLEAGRYLVIWDVLHTVSSTTTTTGAHTTSLRLGTDTIVSYDFPTNSAVWPDGQSVAYSGPLEAGDYNVTLTAGSGSSSHAGVTRIRAIRLPD